MSKLSLAVAGMALVVTTVAVAPVQAALIDFSFATSSGITGSFTLDTDTSPSPDPANFGRGITGISYPNAVSNFSFSSPALNLNGVTADWEVAPTLVFGPPGSPVLSGVIFPSGCSRQANFACLVTVAVAYSGNLSELPVLADNPTSYLAGLVVDRFDPTTFTLAGREEITNFQVSRQVVPEPNGLSILAVGIGGVALLLKRRLEQKGLGNNTYTTSGLKTQIFNNLN